MSLYLLLPQAARLTVVVQHPLRQASLSALIFKSYLSLVNGIQAPLQTKTKSMFLEFKLDP